MEQKPTDPFSGCFVLITGSFFLMIAVLLLLNGCQFSFIDVHLLSKRFASGFVLLVFWVVVLPLLTGSRRR